MNDLFTCTVECRLTKIPSKTWVFIGEHKVVFLVVFDTVDSLFLLLSKYGKFLTKCIGFYCVLLITNLSGAQSK